jgi:adenosylhomocysteine nucleosidase
LISANAEWTSLKRWFPKAEYQSSPYGEWFVADQVNGKSIGKAILFHGGWGKIAAGASTQYAIDRWSPDLLVNLGTCGGFKGEVDVGDIILVERTLVYDIYEAMGDPIAVLKHYETDLDLSWLRSPLPLDVRRALLVSADRDLVAQEIHQLEATHGAIAGDWESGAIAYVAARNHVRCLILRGVSDVVSSQGGEAYGKIALFERRAKEIMDRLVKSLPAWIAQANDN